MMHADTAERHHGYQGRIIKKKEVQMQGNHFADGLLFRAGHQKLIRMWLRNILRFDKRRESCRSPF